MRKIVFATNNAHKLEEVRAILKEKLEILSLEDIGCQEDIAETGNTLEDNALIKARHIHTKYGYDCFGDDTGLEVASLNGAPGVYSARYAGEGNDADANIKKLLHELADKKNREAQFRTVIALIRDNKEYLFEGKIEGLILTEKKGKTGFGYDPIFQPNGFTESFAELGSEAKNDISHRALAAQKLCAFLDTI